MIKYLTSSILAICVLANSSLSGVAAVAEVAKTGSGTSNCFAAGTSQSANPGITVVGGANHALVIFTEFSGNPGAFTANTWNGTAMTQVGSTTVNGSSGGAIAWFILVNPAAGAKNFAATWTNSVTMCSSGVEFSGVNTTTPSTNFTTNSGNNASQAVTVTTANGDAAVGGYTAGNPLSNQASNNQTLIDNGANNGSTNTFGSSYGLAGGTSVAFTWGSFGTTNWSTSGFDVQAPAATCALTLASLGAGC